MVEDRRRAAYEAAVLHYIQGETMETVARRLGVSRSTISRLIASARDEGLVRITLHPPTETSDSLASRLASTFNVSAHVVPVAPSATEVRRLDAVATVAGALISDVVQPGDVVGVAWGTTISAVTEHLTPKAAPGSVVVQLNGAANPSTTGIPYAGHIIDSFAKAFGATVHHFPVPAFFDYAETREAMWRERSLANVLEVQKSVDIAVFGVGAFASPLASHVYVGGYLSDEDMATLRSLGVVGDICTVLLRPDGTYEDIELNRRATGPTPKQLQNIPRRVCVVAGPAKVLPLLGALRAGAVTDLVIDEATAWKLLDVAGQPASAIARDAVTTTLHSGANNRQGLRQQPQRTQAAVGQAGNANRPASWRASQA